MFEKYLVQEKGFKNINKNEETVGYQIQLRIPYYRGIPMSCVEELDIEVDGEKVNPDDYIITVKDEEFTFDELPTVINHRWEMIEPLTVFVKKDGGLQEGEHEVKAFVSLRISYLPFNNVGEDEKVLTIKSN